jgi:hypothetical protein
MVISGIQSALFNFHSFLTVVLLGICACTYLKMHFPAILEQRTGYVLSVVLIVFLFPLLLCMIKRYFL